MASITINLNEFTDTELLAEISQVIMRARGKSVVKTTAENEICTMPLAGKGQTEQDRLADRQKYCMCRIQSAVKVLDNLQLELAKESPESAIRVRAIIRELRTALMDQYLLDSRHLIGVEGRKMQVAAGQIEAPIK